MLRQRNIVRAGFGPIPAGMDSSLPPELLNADRCALLVNADVREVYFGTRPAYKVLPFWFRYQDDAVWCGRHMFQGAGRYVSPGSWSAITFSSGGRVFAWNRDAGDVVELTPTRTVTLTADIISPPQNETVTAPVSETGGLYEGLPVTTGAGRYLVSGVSAGSVTLQNISDTPGVNRPAGTPLTFPDLGDMLADQAWHCQAGRWLIVQDGHSPPMIFDGSTSRRADPARVEVPVGHVMAYHAPIGRLVVAIGNEIAIGDYSGAEADLLKFTEEHELAIGGRFFVPLEYGQVRMLTPLPTLDTTTGHGALLVGATGGVFALNLPPDRTHWKANTRLMTLVATGPGPEHAAGTTANGDVFYRAADGIRSLSATREQYGRWPSIPISGEVGRIIHSDTRRLLRYASIAQAANRLVCTARPAPHRIHPCVHSGLAILDFAPVSKISGGAPPAWAGLWTGAETLQLVSAEDTVIALCASPNGSLYGLDLMSEEPDDPGPTKIRSVMETVAMPRQTLPGLHRLEGAELWLDSVSGECELHLYFRPDEYPCWIDWGTRKCCASRGPCQRDDVCQPTVTYEEGYATRLTWTRPVAGSDTLDAKRLDTGYHFQFRIELTGRARLRRFIGKFEPVVEEVVRTDV